MNLMYLWDQSLMAILPNYYNEDATPQVVYRIKKELVTAMREYVAISKMQEHLVKVTFVEDGVNITVPPELLSRTTH